MPMMMTLSKWSLRVCYHFHKAKSSIQILQLLQQWFFGPEQKQWPSVLQVQYGTTILVLWLNKQTLSTNWAQITFTTLHAEEQQWLSDLWVGLSLRRSVRSGTGDSTRRPPTARRPQLKRGFYEVVKLTSLARKTAQNLQEKALYFGVCRPYDLL